MSERRAWINQLAIGRTGMTLCNRAVLISIGYCDEDRLWRLGRGYVPVFGLCRLSLLLSSSLAYQGMRGSVWPWVKVPGRGRLAKRSLHFGGCESAKPR